MKQIAYPYITLDTSQWAYKNANQAFELLFGRIVTLGQKTHKTVRFENIGFYIDNPTDNHITCNWRKWSPKYAEREWNWYLSHSRDVSELQKHAPTWKHMHGGDSQVNSNYGYQWERNKQLKKVLRKLECDSSTRQAWITLYDGKEQDDYLYDTPCTLNIGFKLHGDPTTNKRFLNMTVIMRSCDLVFGFCNDQYCFSQLQKLVASYLNAEVGTYYHFAQDLHVYLPDSGVYPKHIVEQINKILKNESTD